RFRCMPFWRLAVADKKQLYNDKLGFASSASRKVWVKIVSRLIVAKRSAFFRGFFYATIITTLAAVFLIYFRDLLPIMLTKWYLFLATVGLSAVALINQVAGYRHLLGKDGKSLQFMRLLRIWALSSLLNYLGPFQPGTIARSAILIKYNVSLRASIAASFQW